MTASAIVLGEFLVAGRDPERAIDEIDLCDIGGGRMRVPKRSGLRLEQIHQLGAFDALGKAGVVLDLVGDHELAARDGDRLDGAPPPSNRMGSGWRARRRPRPYTRGARADDDDFRVSEDHQGSPSMG